MESRVLGPGRTPQFLHTQAAAMFHVEDGSFQFLETAIFVFHNGIDLARKANVLLYWSETVS